MNHKVEMKNWQRFASERQDTRDLAAVPEAIRPFLDKFAIESHTTRHDFIKKQTDRELREFCDAWDKHEAEIKGYIDMQDKCADYWPRTFFRFLTLCEAHKEAHEELYVYRNGSKNIVA
jgi:hypothetical protein